MHPVTHNRKNHEVRLHQTDVQEKEKAISEWQRIAESRALDLALAHQTIQLKDNEVTSLKSQLAASQASVDHQKEEKEMRLKAWKDEAEFLNIKLRSKDKAIAELKGDNKRLNEGIEMEKLKKRNIEGIAAKMVETVQKIGELCNLAKPLIEQLSKEKTEGHEIQSPNSSANSGAASLPPASPETKEATGRGQKNWKEDSTDSSSSEQPASSSSSSQHKRSSGSGRYSKRTKGESGSGSDRYSPTSTLQGPPRRQQRERAPVHTVSINVSM